MKWKLKVISISSLLLFSHCLLAQKYLAQKSSVTFFSDAVVEDISAENSKAQGIINLADDKVALAISMYISDFEFPKKLMRAHFNEKYMESEKYPKATFLGTVSGFKPDQKGAQRVTATGQLTMHGVARQVEIPGFVEMRSPNEIQIKSSFIVTLDDFKIKVPKLLWQNIAEQVEVKVEFTLIQK